MFSNILLGAAGFPVADLGDTVSQSLRFSRNQWLASPAVTLSTYTASIWLKLGRMRNPSVSGGVTQIIIGTAGTGGHGVGFSNNKLYSTHTGDESTQEFRDPSGWYHLVINSTGNLYINGVEIATGGGLHDPNNEEIVLGHVWPQNSQNSIYAFEGLLANYHFIDGQELTPTSFARTNDDGVWVPKDYTGTYGSNGARLIFDSSAGIGNDTSGNNNDYSIGGTFDTAAISSSNFDNDIDYNDTPTSNYATLNPLVRSSNRTLANANLQLTMSTDSSGVPATLSVTSGKWYYEVYLQETSSGNNTYIGVVRNVNGASPEEANAIYYRTDFGSIVEFNSQTQSSLTAANADDIVGVEFNLDDDEIAWYVNGTQVGSTESFSSNANDVWSIFLGNGNTNVTKQLDLNFGQMPFIYTQTSGFNAWQTNNLPEPTIKNGKEHFDVLTWSGTSSSNTITGLDFQPDFVWVKKRNGSESHRLADVIRGSTVGLASNNDLAETDVSGSISSFNSNGITVVNAGQTNESGFNYVAWCWKAGGTAVSNTDGTITSSVSANTDAGFSIVSYTGTNAAATVGHGLNSAPEFIIIKNREDNANWIVYHTGTDTTAPEDFYLMLHATDARTGAGTAPAAAFNSQAPSSSVFHVGQFNNTNGSSDDMIAYCWHSVEGYSKFGSYTGNGDADGPFIYLGFRPAWILRKDIDSTNEWTLIDSTRSPDNPTNETLVPNATDAEDADFDIDILSNGFKCRTSESAHNRSGGTYVYMCFAENPFGGENAPPVTAR